MEIANELHIENRQFRRAHECSSNQLPLVRFEDKKKERSTGFQRVVKPSRPQRRQNSSGGHRK